MKKIRSYLAVVALVATLSGPIILNTGATSLANAASGRHVNSASVAGKSTRSVAIHRYGWCPIPNVAC